MASTQLAEKLTILPICRLNGTWKGYIYFKDSPLTKLAHGNAKQMAHDVETLTISSSLAIIAAWEFRLRLRCWKFSRLCKTERKA